MVTIEPQVFYGVIGSAITAIIGAIAIVIRQWSQTRSYAGKKQADGQLMEDKSRANALDTLSEIARQGVAVQLSMVEAVREQTRESGEGRAQMRGMVTMLDDHSKALKNAVLGIDETQVQITGIRSDMSAIKTTTDSLETNLGETVKDQFGPVIEELKNVGAQIGVLVTEVQSRDGHTNTRLTELVILFKDAEKRFMQMLEPIVIKHMAEFLPSDTSPMNGQEKEQTT